MCRLCERPCWRDGGEGECAWTDQQFNDWWEDDDDEPDFSVAPPEDAQPNEEGWEP